MNTSRTDNGKVYEYDRNSALIGKPYTLKKLEAEMDKWEALEEQYEEWSARALVVLILVFAGVVLWKVWVG